MQLALDAVDQYFAGNVEVANDTLESAVLTVVKVIKEQLPVLAPIGNALTALSTIVVKNPRNTAILRLVFGPIRNLLKLLLF